VLVLYFFSYGDVIRILEAEGGMSGYEKDSLKFVTGVKEAIAVQSIV
jgi:hypothetical protein